MKAFKNVNIYVEGTGVVKTDMTFGTEIEKIGKTAENAEIITLPEDAVVVPGFIDEHIHGAGGSDAMDGTLDALHTVAGTVKKEGTTSFLATTMTQSKENISNALKAVKEYMKVNPKDCARILGVHLEGPFISPKHVGAQPLEYVAKPDVKIFKEYNEISGNAIKIVTLAPEEDGAEELVKYLSDNGIVASVGHSGAKNADVQKAIEAGAKSVTHTYNAQSPLHHREIGVVGSALLYDELNSELIADTIHVSVPAIKLLVKCKPSDKLTLITDAMRAKGLGDGVSELGGQTVYVKDGEARLKDGTLAGSVLVMNRAVKNLVEKAGVPFEKAIDCATKNPAINLGVYDKLGSIKEGKTADFAVLDKDFNVIMTIREGEIIYKA